MRRFIITAALLSTAVISVGLSAHPASAFRGERDYREYRDDRYIPKERIIPVERIVPVERTYQPPATESMLYYSLSAGSWIPTHITSVDGSLVPTDTHYDNGIGFGGAVGIDLGNIFRLENELSYRSASGKYGGNMDAFAWMLNAWIEPRSNAPVTPYFGGGFGLGRGHVSTIGPSDGVITGVAYQVGGGLDIRLDRQLSLDIGYRYFGISDAGNTNAAANNELAGSTVMGGLRIRF